MILKNKSRFRNYFKQRNGKWTRYFSPDQKYAYYIKDPDSRSKRLTIEKVPLESLRSTQDEHYNQAYSTLNEKRPNSIKGQVRSKYYPNVRAHSILKEKNSNSIEDHIQHSSDSSFRKSASRSNRKIYQNNPLYRFYQSKNYHDPKFAGHHFYAPGDTKHSYRNTMSPLIGKKFNENQYIEDYFNYIREKNSNNLGKLSSNGNFMTGTQSRSVQPAVTKHTYKKKSPTHTGKKFNENQAFRNYFRDNNTNNFGEIYLNSDSMATVQSRSVHKTSLNYSNHPETNAANSVITPVAEFFLVLPIFFLVVTIITATYYLVKTYRKSEAKSKRVIKKKRKPKKEKLHKDINYHHLRRNVSSSEDLNHGLNQEDFIGIGTENYRADSKDTFSSHIRGIQCCEMQYKNDGNQSNQSTLLHSSKSMDNFYKTQCFGLRNEDDYYSENETLNNSEPSITLSNSDWILQNAIPKSTTQSDTALQTTLEVEDFNSAKYRRESSLSDGHLEYFKREDNLSQSSKSFAEISNSNESENDFKDALEQLPGVNLKHDPNIKNDADLLSDLDKSNLETAASLFRSSSSSFSDESQYYAHSYKHICYRPHVPTL